MVEEVKYRRVLNREPVFAHRTLINHFLRINQVPNNLWRRIKQLSTSFSQLQSLVYGQCFELFGISTEMSKFKDGTGTGPSKNIYITFIGTTNSLTFRMYCSIHISLLRKS